MLARIPPLWPPDWGARAHPGRQDHRVLAPGRRWGSPGGGWLTSFALRTIPVCMTNEPVTLATRLLLGLSTRRAGSFQNWK